MANVATRGNLRHVDQENSQQGRAGAIVKKRAAVPVSRPGLGLVTNKTTKTKSSSVRQEVTKPLTKRITNAAAAKDSTKSLIPLRIEPMETDVKRSVEAVIKSVEAMDTGTPSRKKLEAEAGQGDVKNVFNTSDNPEVGNIDKEDDDNPQLCSEFVNDVYHYMLFLENEYPVHKLYLKDTPLKPRMRTILVDWLFQVHHRFGLLQETMYLTVAILDRFLQLKPVDRTKLQLAGVTAMLLASKYEEMYAPEVNDFVYITDQAFTRSQVLQMEILMLKTLEFNLGRPLPLHFLRRISKAGQVDANQHTLAKYLMELSMLDYEMCHIPPSKIAAAALCLSIKLFDDNAWSPTLEHYSRYSNEKLHPVVCHLSKNLKAAKTSSYLAAVRTKYASSKAMNISVCDEIKSPLVAELAEEASGIVL